MAVIVVGDIDPADLERSVRTIFGGLTGQRKSAAPPDNTVPLRSELLVKVTSDPERYRRNTDIYRAWPQLGLGGPTIRWLKAAAEAAEAVSDPDFMARIQVPMLIVAAGADQVVSTKAVESYARRLRVGSLLMIDAAHHEILQEKDLFREQLLAAFDAFIPGTGDAV